MGRPQSVSKWLNKKTLISVVKAFSKSGGYIPVPRKIVGKKVKVIVYGDEET